MKRLTLVLLVLAAAAPAAFAQVPLVANLSGANEVPPADPDGTGTALVTITGTTVAYSITVNNIDAPTMQHIHSGAAGVNGPIVVALTGTWVGSGSGPWTLNSSVVSDAATVNAILANPAAFYVNVHNGPFPGGAVRGQLAFAPAVAEDSVPTASEWALIGLAAMLALAGIVALRRL